MACTDPLPHWGPRCSRNLHSLHFCTAKGADLNRRWPFPVLIPRDSGSIESGYRTSRGCDDLWIFGHGHPASRGCIGPRAGYVLCQEQAHPPSALATKSVTQTSSHVIKLGYYLTVIGLTVDLPFWVYMLVIAAASAGNSVGKSLVAKIDDVQFRYAGRIIILTMGTLSLGNGIWLLVF